MPASHPKPTPDNPLGFFPAPPKPRCQPWRRFSPYRISSRAALSRMVKGDAEAGFEVEDSAGLMQSLAQLLPPMVTEAFEELGGTIHLLGNAEFRSEWQEAPAWNVPARAWRAWDTTGLMGFFDPLRGNFIAVRRMCSSRKPAARALMGWKTAVDIAGHEMGHFVDFCCHKVSHTAKFNAAFLAERHMLDSYSAGNVEEFFADAFWLHCAYPEASKRFLPETDRWFTAFLHEDVMP